jgi:DNA-binding XRE family transcriptional regulator
VKKQSANGNWKLALAFFRVVLLTIREIFDESAYDRFLVRTGSNRSADSYREFSRERELSVARKPRCC